MAENKLYFDIIPAEVRYDKDLSANAKLLYGEITALCNEKGCCWASNDYFSQLYGKSKHTVSRWVSELTQKGYIQSEISKENGNVRILTPMVKNVVANNLLARVYADMAETAKKSGISEANLTDYITKMLGHCCI